MIFSGRSFKWINTVIEMLVNRGEIFVVKRDAIVNTGAGTCNGHINIVAGPADPRLTRRRSRARIARWNVGLCGVPRFAHGDEATEGRELPPKGE